MVRGPDPGRGTRTRGADLGRAAQPAAGRIRRLGRIIDQRFAADIARTDADPCGENGEYHSFAFAGPVFTKPVQWMAGERRQEAGFAQLDLSGA
jgi:diphthamide synthase (EF-2-diphthine--ammonia ligase)